MSRFSPASSNGGGSSTSSSMGNTIIGLGDSITIGNGSFGSASFSNGDTSWFSHACVLSLGKLNLTYNAGISGNTTTQMLARIQTDVIAKSPKLCAILGGTNDVTNGITVTTTLSNITSVVNQLIQAGITPILCTIPPQSISGNRAKGVQINHAIRGLAQKYKLLLVDFYSILVDPVTGLYISGYSPDNIHPNATSAKLMGQLFADKVTPYLPSAALLPGFDSDGFSKVLGGLFLTDTNADGIGDNWTKSGTGTATTQLVTDANILGKWQELNKTVNDANSVTLTSNTVSTNGSSGLNAGEKALVCFRIQTSGIESGVANFSVRFAWDGSGGGPYLLKNWTKDISSAIYYQEITVPSPNFTCSLQVIINAGTGIVRVSQVGIYGLTALGL